MKTIGIIGLGQLGSRHLQALARVKEAIRIELVDVSESSLDTAVSRFYEMPESSSFAGGISKHKSLKNLPGELDFVIVSCNSNERRSVVESLLKEKKVKYLLLEKVLFPKLEDYAAVEKLLSTTSTMTWVNCSRRAMPDYQALKKMLTPKTKIDFSVTGSQWGLGSNGIHFIDLFHYLSDTKDLTLDASLLDDANPIQSHRKGYIDFTGSIIGKTSGGDSFKMISYATGNLPLQVVINTPFERIIVDEYRNSVTISSSQIAWQVETRDFQMLYQSQMTHIIFEQLLTTHTCNLPVFKEASVEHQNFLQTLLTYLSIKRKEEQTTCPIT